MSVNSKIDLSSLICQIQNTVSQNIQVENEEQIAILNDILKLQKQRKANLEKEKKEMERIMQAYAKMKGGQKAPNSNTQTSS